jgi:hypothetical protein
MGVSEEKDEGTVKLTQLKKDADLAKLIGTIAGIGTIVGAGFVLPVAVGAVTAVIAGTAGTGITAFMLGKKLNDEKQIKQLEEQSQAMANQV